MFIKVCAFTCKSEMNDAVASMLAINFLWRCNQSCLLPMNNHLMFSVFIAIPVKVLLTLREKVLTEKHVFSDLSVTLAT